MPHQEQGAQREMTIEEWGDVIRKDIKAIGDTVWALRQHSTFSGEQSCPNGHSEMRANIMLTYRHLEDARMRVGKIMQAYQGGGR